MELLDQRLGQAEGKWLRICGQYNMVCIMVLACSSLCYVELVQDVG